MYFRPLFASKRKGDKWQLEEILKVLGTPCKEDWPTETAIVIEQFSVYPIRSLSHHISVLTRLQEQLLSVCRWYNSLYSVASAWEGYCSHRVS